MSSNGFLSNHLSIKTSFFGLRLWVVVGIGIGALFILILFGLYFWLSFRRRPSRVGDKRVLLPVIPNVSKEIKEVKYDKAQVFTSALFEDSGNLNLMESGAQKAPQLFTVQPIPAKSAKDQKEILAQEKMYQSIIETDTSIDPMEIFVEIQSFENFERAVSQLPRDESAESSPNVAEISHLGWGQWYTLSELEVATDNFLEQNIIGEGGYGIVYKGKLLDGTLVAVKNLFNNRGQAEKEFKVEVEAIGKVRHKNLVRLLGYCAEGDYRMLIYEYVGNGNLEQWLHGSERLAHDFSWEARMKIVLGTAKALAYLHEALEPKVVHRDIKSSNILIDLDWTPKLSDFGLAKMLASGESHLTTRVMGTFGYVAPEYANTGLLNEKSDVYSFGVLLMEVITGRDPVNYGRPPEEVTLVDWLKTMVASRRFSELVDPNLEIKPSSTTLKRSLLIALRCVDQDSTKRPKMSIVAHMLEQEDFPFQTELKKSQKMDRWRQNGIAVNQAKMIRSLSKEIEIECGAPPRPFKKRWRKYER